MAKRATDNQPKADGEHLITAFLRPDGTQRTDTREEPCGYNNMFTQDWDDPFNGYQHGKYYESGE